MKTILKSGSFSADFAFLCGKGEVKKTIEQAIRQFFFHCFISSPVQRHKCNALCFFYASKKLKKISRVSHAPQKQGIKFSTHILVMYAR